MGEMSSTLMLLALPVLLALGGVATVLIARKIVPLAREDKPATHVS
jgi:hypothetical protein